VVVLAYFAYCVPEDEGCDPAWWIEDQWRFYWMKRRRWSWLVKYVSRLMDFRNRHTGKDNYYNGTKISRNCPFFQYSSHTFELRNSKQPNINHNLQQYNNDNTSTPFGILKFNNKTTKSTFSEQRPSFVINVLEASGGIRGANGSIGSDILTLNTLMHLDLNR